MKVEVRESSATFGETSGQGDTQREEKGYELGAEIDGVFVVFASVDQAQLDHAAQRQEYADAQAESSGSKPKRGKSRSGSAKDEPAADESSDASDLSKNDPPK